MKFDSADAAFLKEHGVTPEKASEELEMIKIGFPYLEIESPATPGHGIFVLTDKMKEDAEKIWKEYIADGGKAMKFVPASGAATRMFKNLHEFVHSSAKKPDTDFLKTFFNEIQKFSFFRRLNFLATRYYQKSILRMIREGDYKEIISMLLDKKGLNYGHVPKALVHFHIVPGTARTAMEEHFTEGAQYAADKNRHVRLHFTVSPEHLPLVAIKIEEVKEFFERKYDVTYDVELSVQKPATDTIAANMEGEPFRDKDGHLLLRPGGHGALIANLNDIDGDVIFIKNIDNVTCESKRHISLEYKQYLAGVLVGTRQRIFNYMAELEKGIPSASRLEEMLDFLRKVLFIRHDEADSMTDAEKADYIRGKLNRPIRVCGMVKNEGEPGGGPFLAYNSDGTYSPQILETSQIDKSDEKAMKMLHESTHFNPVDIVCSIRDWKGNKYDLFDFIDQNTGFVSHKSKDGVELQALELPGLWNGAMSDWNTIFVEVPSATFNPVKTVNDLLRPMHQNME